MKVPRIAKSKKMAKAIVEIESVNRMNQVMADLVIRGKQALDEVTQGIGILMVEAILLMEREQIAGPDYKPLSPNIVKGGSQPGSVYLGSSKVKIQRPRVHGPDREITLDSYKAMRQRGAFSDEIMTTVLNGLSARRFDETVIDTAASFGVKKSSVSNHIVELTSKKLQEFLDRDLSDFETFAVVMDSIHRHGHAFIVALGIDKQGFKRVLGFWQGATENGDVAKMLIDNLESRGLRLSDDIVWVTDGGSGLIKHLKDRYGKNLIHVRCWIHKLRNVVRHLPKKYRDEAKRRFLIMINCIQYGDAKREMPSFESWLREINISAANSLNEGSEEVLTLHRLRASESLRKTLGTTNSIESLFATTRDCEMNVKRWRSSKMSQRWLATVFLHAEKGFRRIKGYRDIENFMRHIAFEKDKLAKAA